MTAILTIGVSQSALLKYWSFQPTPKEEPGDDKGALSKAPDASNTTLNDRKVNIEEQKSADSPASSTTPKAANPAPQIGNQPLASGQDCGEEDNTPKKLVPVIFFDEAHRLPLLIRDRKAMKCILDAMLVLTKQVSGIACKNPPQAERFTGPADTRYSCDLRSVLYALAEAAKRHAALQDHVDRRCFEAGSRTLFPRTIA